ncbi:MAG: DUF4156 domain-containing protein [Pseudomonadales bacterium]
MNQPFKLTTFTAWALISLAMTACTWVSLEEGGESVALIPASATGLCQRIGATTSRSATKVGLYERDEEKVAMELLNLAKNAAASMGGDAIVEKGPMTNGEQAFEVYRCKQDQPE